MLSILGVAAAGCSRTRIPYVLAGVEAGAEPIHPVRVAVLPLRDARVDVGDGQDLFRYRGRDYRATDLSDLSGDPTHRVTEILAWHLAKARVFAQVILVLDASQAPEADLFLSGTIYRMRGYVELSEESDAPALNVLSEVVLKDLTLVHRAAPHRRLLVADAGWSVLEDRPVQPDGEGPSPWRVLADALYVAVDAFVEMVKTADLSGELVIEEEVALDVAGTSTPTAFGLLPDAPPSGWRSAPAGGLERPIGWQGAPECRAHRMVQKQRLRFHRVLGPYRSTVQLWACPPSVALSYDTAEEFPATFLGERDRVRYFGRSVGQTNWPKALEQVRAHLAITPPSSRYVFELPAVATSSAASGP